MSDLTEHERIRLIEYFDGRLSPESQRELEAWIAAQPGRNTAVARLRLAWDVAGQTERGEWGVLGLKVGGEHAAPRGLQEGRAGFVSRTLRGGMRGLGSQILRHSLWIGITGALVLGIAVLTRHRSGSDSEITRTYATRAYQQATLNLADGTRITLAPQTAVRLLHFGASVRTVLLDSGEAYFEVAHAAGVPFIVKSGPATTQVLGTAFLVRHIAGDSQVLVAVADGKVRIRTLSHRDAGVLLTSRHIGAVTDSTVHVSAVSDIDPHAQWSRDHMLFRDTPLAIVLQTISQWYGYRFRYADRTMGAQKVTIMVSAKSSAEALATVEQVLAVNLTVNGDTITLVPKPEQSEQTAPRIRTYDVWTPTREVGR